jgi:hypothetical protein
MTEQFQAALAKLEKCLETPLVPGELELWVQQTKTAAQDVADLLDRQINDVHREQLAEIEQQDLELLSRVDELRQGDEQTRVLLRALQDRLIGLASRAARVEPDEKQAEGDLAAVVDMGLKFVIHARTQETALETWLAESFERDRGTVD